MMIPIPLFHYESLRSAAPRCTRLFVLAWLLLVAAPAQAKVVEFTATLRNGFGNVLTPSSQNNPGANGLPICVAGNTTHSVASVPAHGFVEVSSGPAPQKVEAVRPFAYGPPGVAGTNGAARYTLGTCAIAVSPGHLPNNDWNALTVSSSFSWPADRTVTTTGTAVSGGKKRAVGTAPEAHSVSAGGGPGSFTVVAATSPSQFLRGIPGPNQFGGGFRAGGFGRRSVAKEIGPGFTASGYWISGPRLTGHGSSPPTQTVAGSGSFSTSFGGVVPVEVRVWNMPFTTGTVTAFDDGGTFQTLRTAAGFDNRTSMGEMGTLLLVSPWAANVQSLGIYISGTSELEFTFLPEPTATMFLACSLLGVLGLHQRARRNR